MGLGPTHTELTETSKLKVFKVKELFLLSKYNTIQRCKHGEIFGLTSAMGGGAESVPIIGIENLCATMVTLVAPAVTSLTIVRCAKYSKLQNNKRNYKDDKL